MRLQLERDNPIPGPDRTQEPRNEDSFKLAGQKRQQKKSTAQAEGENSLLVDMGKYNIVGQRDENCYLT